MTLALILMSMHDKHNVKTNNQDNTMCNVLRCPTGKDEGLNQLVPATGETIFLENTSAVHADSIMALAKSFLQHRSRTEPSPLFNDTSLSSSAQPVKT